MKRKTLILTTTAVLISIGGLGALGATAALAHDHGGFGYGMMQGMDRDAMHERMRAMRHDGGYGGEGCANRGQTLDKPLTVDAVKAQLDKRLEWRGNKRLKAGAVTELNDKTITAEVVTQDGSLVNKYMIDRTTGRWTPMDN